MAGAEVERISRRVMQQRNGIPDLAGISQEYPLGDQSSWRGRGQKLMDANTTLKARLPSRHVTEGPQRAPHRSYYYAMGLTTEQIHQPFVGVASCWNEAAPCNIALMRHAQAVKKGVAAAGGTPREFCTITVTDGIAMGHEGMKSSLSSRGVIADSVELTIRGHGHDALVGLAGCDKSLPGMMTAMYRLNVQAIFIYERSILPGSFKGQPGTVQDVFEAVGRHSVGPMSDGDLDELEQAACQSAGACGAQFTANTMATVSEAAIAHECGTVFDLFDVADVFRRTPYVADLKPDGRYVAKDLFEADGVPLLMKTLLDDGYLDGSCLTVTGRSVVENLKNVKWNSLLRDGDMIDIDAVAGALDVRLEDDELARRRHDFKPREAAFASGYLWKYAQQVGPARTGAVTHPGGAAEKTCYADI
jgi:dihydroxyacid dehydratase/phosphogluconate dehydratase